ncbi:MAG TPA: NUDIX domain-containing protein [Nocardioidaceae bacterium]|nr:NUDIX domain-containing protein [Nocardioidaceae bacterium]
MPPTIEAAGGVLWRPANGRVDTEIALVHRPAQDDWSLPKGKLVVGEHALLGALREVAEETGYRSAAGIPLGCTRYHKDSAPKRVRYWALRARHGRFAPTKEVDDLVWLPPDAAARLARGRDRPIIDAFQKRRPHHVWPLLLVRHARALSPGAWTGPDQERPLDGRGRLQAAALAQLLDAYAVRRVLAADLRRCRQTLTPLAAERHIALESEPRFTKRAVSADLDAAVRRLVDLALAGVPTVVCAQRSVVQRLRRGMAAEFGDRRKSGTGVGKGGFYAVHLRDEGPTRLSTVERVATSA